MCAHFIIFPLLAIASISGSQIFVGKSFLASIIGCKNV